MCPACTADSPRAERSTHAWERIAREAVARHRAAHGDTCPGYGREPHTATDLTADHVLPLARGGTSSRGNLQILCRSCNSRKNTH